MKNNPRVMLVGTGSGCGKTTVTCALLKALKNRKLNITSFKCGPDYIDPMFHSEIIGTKSRNLDIFLCGENTVKYLLAKDSEEAEIAVIEGVMGMYDGKGFDDDQYSANHISLLTETPELLVVNVRGKSVSLIAELSGYLSFSKNNLRGVILNNCSKAMYAYYKKMVEEKLNLRVYGFMPSIKEAEIGSRHLGLITAAEIDDLKEKIRVLGDTALECLDIEGIIALAGEAGQLSYEDINIGQTSRDVVNIAVAKDKAFCFYYEDNFALMEKYGARFIPFSPLEDSKLPEHISGIILGGGYPEEYMEQLSQNTSMRDSIKYACEQGMPVYAECGGFMYLGESVEKDGNVYPGVGVLSGNAHMTDNLVRFGYKELTANYDNMMCKAGEKIKCHEFHYSDTDCIGDGFTASKGSRTWPCIVATDNIFAGYPHIHMWSNIKFAANFVKKCKSFDGGTEWK